MNSLIHFEQDTNDGVVRIYRGKKIILEVKPLGIDQRYHGFETREGIVTAGAKSCSAETSPKCETFAASRDVLSDRMKNLGIDETMADQILSQLHGGT